MTLVTKLHLLQVWCFTNKFSPCYTAVSLISHSFCNIRINSYIVYFLSFIYPLSQLLQYWILIFVYTLFIYLVPYWLQYCDIIFFTFCDISIHLLVLYKCVFTLHNLNLSNFFRFCFVFVLCRICKCVLNYISSLFENMCMFFIIQFVFLLYKMDYGFPLASYR